MFDLHPNKTYSLLMQNIIKYMEIFSAVKIENLIFQILAQNIDCGYMLEPPRQDTSNEYSQSIFWSKNKKKLSKIFY